MEKKGFTLVEVIISLFLLGLLTITIFPILETSVAMVDKNNVKLEMIYIGEMTIEKLKAFKEDNKEDLFIYDMKVKDIIDLFSKSEEVSLTISTGDTKKYKIQISKKEKNEKLWIIYVLVSHTKGEKYEDVEYKAFLPKE